MSGTFSFNASVVKQSTWVGVKKHCECIVLVRSRCTSTCHVVFFCHLEVSGCVSCQTYGLFLLLIFRRALSKETPLNTVGDGALLCGKESNKH